MTTAWSITRTDGAQWLAVMWLVFARWASGRDQIQDQDHHVRVHAFPAPTQQLQVPREKVERGLRAQRQANLGRNLGVLTRKKEHRWKNTGRARVFRGKRQPHASTDAKTPQHQTQPSPRGIGSVWARLMGKQTWGTGKHIWLVKHRLASPERPFQECTMSEISFVLEFL